MASIEEPFKLGDRLILREIRASRFSTGDREVVVYKAGRKWGYAKPEGSNYPDVKFDLWTGYEDGGRYSPSWRVLTPEQNASEKARREIEARLKELGVEFGFGGPRKFSTETLERVADILAADIEAQ